MNSLARRRLLRQMAALGAATLLRSGRVAAEPLEVDRIRLVHSPSICLAPQYLAEDLLRLEGFAHVEYVSETLPKSWEAVASGAADISMETAPNLVSALDHGAELVAIGGIHAGCYELCAHAQIGAIRDLRGRSLAVSDFGGADHLFLSSILAYVGIDPRTDVNWVVAGRTSETLRLFQERKVHAFLGFPPQPQLLREQKIGHTLLNTGEDRPWSQYFCCMVTARRDFASRYPVATKRTLRALLSAADMCAGEPERAAKLLAERGYERRYEVALDVLRSLPYRRWREADPEDTLRFYALRLRDVGMVRSTPQKIIAQGTDWRFFNELKKELKA
ncbi:MAG: ABC transporter substrate-binding protein [Burkholderiales bacterium]